MQNVTPGVSKFMNPVTVILVVVGIVVVSLLGTSVYIVDQTEEAVVTRFGKFNAIYGPGLHFKLPFGIDHQYLVNVTTVQTEQFGFRTLRSGVSSTYSNLTNESTMLTGDLNIIEVEWIIQYRITDPMAWVFNVMERTETIRDVSRSAINMLVGDRPIMDIMGSQRSTIENEGAAFMNETFRGYGLGIDVIAVKLQNIDPPAGVQEAFDDVNKAEQDQNRLINEGQQAYNAEIPRAKGEADRLIQIAQGYEAERINKANGDVARFNSVYEEYRKAPDVTRQRLYYEMMEEVFKDDTETVIIDRNFNNFLPLRDLNASRSSGGAR
ncbi:HflK protein [Treponema primitia ZAS-2]|uniref:Protein HflK n=1 Tax=Treponema primitia (strain ATCC BAA-887 / DSM 12427 / ZAS-2) TaxID=545694 RepID=F5YGZ0_TREPZ|nr:FtsH protease activity modulator HflK [Treponema primitia]AEF86984.1 HflK protein [Treponema primitia ZAS-2]